MGTKVYITPSGMIGSIRNVKDKITYIGSQARQNGEIINDFILSNKDGDIGERHAMIKYWDIKKKYRVLDLS